MPGRLPTPSDFPSSITLTITPPPSSHPATNILLLLHGLGDTHTSFKTLGQNLNLPETLCISLRAPHPLPFDIDGFHWGDDMVFDQSTGEMEVDTGFKTATRIVLEDVIKGVLIGKCGYTAREIMIFGYAQGAMVALQVAAEHEGEFGGVVGIGGFLSLSLPLKALDKKSMTPVLVCKGDRNSGVSESRVRKLRDVFEFVEVTEWRKVGDGMPNSREEMLPIMRFFARRLRSLRGVPAGSVELS